MLTLNDKTVENAIECFQSCVDLPIEYWGFKNVGIPYEKMTELVKVLKKNSKKIVLEIVSYDEEEGLKAIRFAKAQKVDYLIGTIFNPKFKDELKGTDIQYLPFVGKVYGAPSILEGSFEDFANQLNYFEEQKLEGVDLLAYRYACGDGLNLAQVVVKQTTMKVVIAGSINSERKIRDVLNLNPWAFTIGSALFRGKFLEGKDFRANLQKVIEIIDNLS